MSTLKNAIIGLGMVGASAAAVAQDTTTQDGSVDNNSNTTYVSNDGIVSTDNEVSMSYDSLGAEFLLTNNVESGLGIARTFDIPVLGDPNIDKMSNADIEAEAKNALDSIWGLTSSPAFEFTIADFRTAETLIIAAVHEIQDARGMEERFEYCGPADNCSSNNMNMHSPNINETSIEVNNDTPPTTNSVDTDNSPYFPRAATNLPAMFSVTNMNACPYGQKDMNQSQDTKQEKTKDSCWLCFDW